MKKKIFLTLVAVLIFGTVIVCALQPKTGLQTDFLNKMGSDLKESVGAISDEIQRESNTRDSLETEIAGTISGKPISVAAVDVKAVLYKYAGSKTPLEDAWNALKMEAFEYEFAKEHELLPTDEEINLFTQEMRAAFESDEDGLLYEKTVLDAMGMTADFYWEVYKPQIESPVHLIKIHIADYCDENGILWDDIISSMDVESEFTNEALIEKYSESVTE